jgi:hypothetical protein
LNLASAKIFLKFGNSAFSHLNPIGAFLLETITGKAAEFPMRSPQRIQFFSSNGRPPRQGVKAGFFTFFDRFFLSVSRCFSFRPIPVVLSNDCLGPFAGLSPAATGGEFIRKSGRTQNRRIDRIPTAQPFDSVQTK